jgi:hypothetical protein
MLHHCGVGLRVAITQEKWGYTHFSEILLSPPPPCREILAWILMKVKANGGLSSINDIDAST